MSLRRALGSNRFATHRQGRLSGYFDGLATFAKVTVLGDRHGGEVRPARTLDVAALAGGLRKGSVNRQLARPAIIDVKS
jgi:hypothetical protein